MKKVLGLVVIVIIIIVGVVLLTHKSNKPSTNTNSNTSTRSSSNSSTPAVNNAVLITKSSSTLGQYLAEPNGAPLYTFGGDKSGVSNCTGSCLAAWPAYQDKGSTTGLPSGVGTIQRNDNGETQYTYNGLPLYTFATDTGGTPTGNGVSNFSLAKPVAQTNQPAASSGY